MATPTRFMDDEIQFTGRYGKTVFNTLRQAYRPFRRALWTLTVIGFLGRVLLMSNANLIGYWADSFCVAPTPCRPGPMIFAGYTTPDFLQLLLMVTVLGFALTLIFRIGFSRRSAQAVSLMYDEVTYRASRFPMRFFDTTPAGRIITRFSSDYGGILRLFGGPMAEFLGIIFDIVAMFLLVMVASPYYFPLFVLVALINYGVYLLNSARIRKERREMSACRSPSIAHFAETVQGASTIRVFSKQKSFADRFSKLNDVFLRQKLRTSFVILGFSFQMSALTAFLLMLTGGLGYYLVANGLASVGSVGVAFTFVTLSGNSLQMFFEWVSQIEEAMTGVERLDNYLRRPLEPGLRLPERALFETDHARDTVESVRARNEAPLQALPRAGVRVENLWFRYSPDLPPVLKGLDFEIQPGEHLGVIGRTGSGKSSLIQALLHLYPVEKGRILIHGLEAQTGPPESGGVDLQAYRQAVAFIAQEPVLFLGLLRENLTVDPRITDARLREVLARVGLEEWLDSQPDGLDMKVEERGRNLSLGERQLVCMARCLLQEAPVVIMDEATSSIDPQSEEILVRATRDFFGDRTQIIIAHRLSTLEHCDRILWLQNGEIRMLDTPEKVLPVFRSAQLAL